uniref:Uncharacterized protein n=1 Tax=Chromera velia CCMP2878 TaxID=1169474 RepID=A0A0G4FHG5_9ALVE|eukprot:Cvel_3317.t1-p1 / transcript=Cvel_3317.t1 / gene=Cvel_3317 / organism=Chromera_velia_CCMP2878 / gene_product=hypothetical protein / transcript_product=hypothetical protein / location=Cvel_scaffold131:119934-125158(-) / protein_length=311 / sequence_SO=supercontig / SO=protein_coding / is_pseudo=false
MGMDEEHAIDLDGEGGDGEGKKKTARGIAGGRSGGGGTGGGVGRLRKDKKKKMFRNLVTQDLNREKKAGMRPDYVYDPRMKRLAEETKKRRAEGGEMSLDEDDIRRLIKLKKKLQEQPGSPDVQAEAAKELYRQHLAVLGVSNLRRLLKTTFGEGALDIHSCFAAEPDKTALAKSRNPDLRFRGKPYMDCLFVKSRPNLPKSMWWGQIERRLRETPVRGERLFRNSGEILAAMDLILDNCRTFNGHESRVSEVPADGGENYAHFSLYLKEHVELVKRKLRQQELQMREATQLDFATLDRFAERYADSFGAG